MTTTFSRQQQTGYLAEQQVAPRRPRGPRPARLARTLAKGVALATLAAASLAPGIAFADRPPAVPDVPANIAVTDGSVPYLTWHAVGTQDYVCDGNAWVFTGPSASLYDANGKLRGTHSPGPKWQAHDGSSVIAAAEASAPVADAIAWLRLKVVSFDVGPDGGDRLEGTTYIQRVNTSGGVKPASGCDAAHLGAEQNVPYTADYYFYRLPD